MRYIYIENPGHAHRLLVQECPKPDISATQILVRVHATALNRADLMQKLGNYPPPPGETNIPGLEVAGEVVALGAKVTQFSIGDKVYGLVGSGAYAEYCAVEASLAHQMPENWDYKHAAALPEALTTVYATLFDLGKLKTGQTLLIHGGGSGIASLAIQMAHLAGATVITTVGTKDKASKAHALGADQVIDYKENKFENLIEDNSVDVIIDYIGGNYLNKHLQLLKPQGKLIQIACINGSKSECNLALILRKRLQIFGFALRPQNLKAKARLWRLAHQHWFTALNENRLAPVIDSVFSLDQIEDAHLRMQQSLHFGKIVVAVANACKS